VRSGAARTPEGKGRRRRLGDDCAAWCLLQRSTRERSRRVQFVRVHASACESGDSRVAKANDPTGSQTDTRECHRTLQRGALHTDSKSPSRRRCASATAFLHVGVTHCFGRGRGAISKQCGCCCRCSCVPARGLVFPAEPVCARARRSCDPAAVCGGASPCALRRGMGVFRAHWTTEAHLRAHGVAE